MLNNIKLRIIGSIFQKGGCGRLLNLVRHYLEYPTSRHVLGGGIHIISRCNLSCSFCTYGMGPERKFDDMDPETFEKCLNSPIFKNVLYLYLGKGEPFLHEHLFEFTKRLRERGIVSLIATNGLLIRKRMEQLLASPPDILWVSLYDQHLPQQLEALSLLIQQRPKRLLFGATRLINKDNLGDIEKLTDILGSMGIENVWFQQYSIDPSQAAEIRKRIYTTDHQELAYIRMVEKRQRRRFPRLKCQFPHPIPSSPKTFRCLSLEKGPGIEPNGAIQPCCYIDPRGKDHFGNIFNDPWAHIHNGSYMNLKNSLRKGSNADSLFLECRNCPLINLKV